MGKNKLADVYQRLYLLVVGLRHWKACGI
nr:hypothetical protein [Klebsiella quasipneumoniae]